MASTSASSAFDNSQSGSGSQHGQIIVEYGQERLLIDLPPPTATLRDLKNILYDRTGIRPDQMTLMSTGFKLKNDNATLQVLGLTNNVQETPSNQGGAFSSFLRGFSWSSSSKPAKPMKRLLLIGSPETHASVSDTSSSLSSNPALKNAFHNKANTAVADESTVIQRINQIKSTNLDPLLPRLDALESTYSSTPTPATSSQEWSILSELFLQVLLKLDSIDISSEWLKARSERKAGVKQVQACLDRLDALKMRSKVTTGRPDESSKENASLDTPTTTTAARTGQQTAARI